jgi:hypothetical protein
MRVFCVLMLVAFSISPTLGSAAKNASQANLDINKEELHSLYTEGEFDVLNVRLQRIIDSKAPMARDESLFVFKHLGVVLAADSTKKENAKYYLLKLLSIDSSSTLFDMDVSDGIYSLFKNLKDEHRARLISKSVGDFASMPNQNPASATSRKANATTRRGNRHLFYWTAGGAVFFAVAGGAVYFLQPKPSVNKYYALP